MTSIFKVIFTYTSGEPGKQCTIPRTVLVSAISADNARDRVAKWFIKTKGANPSFLIKSVTLCPTIYDIIS